jgi:methionyl-tRNA formyltransferase
MLPEIVWAMPEYGTFNVHAALLPQYRGAAPINWAVINGETQTGVTTFFLDHDIDTGRIIMRKTFDIPDDADVEYVYDGLMRLGAEICLETLDAIVTANGHPETVSQDNCQLSVDNGPLKPAPKIFKETCETDWSKTAKQVYDFVRGLSPYPGVWTTVVSPSGTSTVLKIFKATKTERKAEEAPGHIVVEKNTLLIAAGDAYLQIDELQMAGKKRMSARDFLNGSKNLTASRCVRTNDPV